jgi:hypothetical protein
MISVAKRLVLLDPRVLLAGTEGLSPRLSTLDGKTVGVIWNSRPPGDLIMDGIFRILGARYHLGEIIVRKKPYVGNLAPAEILDELARKCDAVVTGVGDCGSCTSASVLDAITMERRGVPAAMVGAERLVRTTGRGMASLQGIPDFPLAVIPGIGQMEGIREDRDKAKIESYAADLAPQVESILLKGRSS